MSTRPGSEVIDRDPHLSTWYHHAPYGVYQCKDARDRGLDESARRSSPKRSTATSCARSQTLDRYEHRDDGRARLRRRAEDAHLRGRRRGVRPSTTSGTVRCTTSTTSPTIRRSRRSTCSGRPRSTDGRSSSWSTIRTATTARCPELRIKGLKVGEHTREILAEHGYTPEQIDDLFARDVVTGPSSSSPPAVPQAAAAGSA